MSTWGYVPTQKDEVVLPEVPIMMPKIAYPRKVQEFCRQNFKLRCETAVDLVDKILVCNPKERLKASEALDHSFFWSTPPACRPAE